MNGNGLAASCWQSSMADGRTDVGGCDLAVCKSYVKLSTKLLAYSWQLELSAWPSPARSILSMKARRWSSRRSNGAWRVRAMCIVCVCVRVRMRIRAWPSVDHHHNIVHNAAFQVVHRRQLLVAMSCGGGHLHDHIVILGGVRTVWGQHQRIVDAPRGRMQIVRVVWIDFRADAIIVVIIIGVFVFLAILVLLLLCILLLRPAFVVGFIVVLVLDVVGQQLCSVRGVADASVSVFLFLPARWLRLRFRLWFQLWQTVGEKYYSICKEPKGEGGARGAGMREVQKQFSAEKVQIRVGCGCRKWWWWWCGCWWCSCAYLISAISAQGGVRSGAGAAAAIENRRWIGVDPNRVRAVRGDEIENEKR